MTLKQMIDVISEAWPDDSLQAFRENPDLLFAPNVIEMEDPLAEAVLRILQAVYEHNDERPEQEVIGAFRTAVEDLMTILNAIELTLVNGKAQRRPYRNRYAALDDPELLATQRVETVFKIGNQDPWEMKLP